MSEKQFIEIWVKKVSDENIKIFPDDFLSTEKTYIYKLPNCSLILGEELFGKIELIDKDGNQLILCETMQIAKYILYANRSIPSEISIPELESEMQSLLKKYENYFDNLLREIKNDFSHKFPASKNFPQVSNQIFNQLNIKRF